MFIGHSRQCILNEAVKNARLPSSWGVGAGGRRAGQAVPPGSSLSSPGLGGHLVQPPPRMPGRAPLPPCVLSGLSRLQGPGWRRRPGLSSGDLHVNREACSRLKSPRRQPQLGAFKAEWTINTRWPAARPGLVPGQGGHSGILPPEVPKVRG